MSISKEVYSYKSGVNGFNFS